MVLLQGLPDRARRGGNIQVLLTLKRFQILLLNHSVLWTLKKKIAFIPPFIPESYDPADL